MGFIDRVECTRARGRAPVGSRRPVAKLCSSVLEVGVAFAERHRGGSDRESDADGKREASTSGGTWRGRVLLKSHLRHEGPDEASVALRLAVHWVGVSREGSEVCGNPRVEPMRPSDGLPSLRLASHELPT